MTHSNTAGSVTKWIDALQTGAESPISDVWIRYYARLAELAKAHIANHPSKAVDGEDVASHVLFTVCRRVATGKYPDLKNRNDLWNLLFKITQRKIAGEKRNGLRQKRGSGKVLLATDANRFLADSGNPPVAAISKEPNIESAIELRDLYRHLIDLLPADKFQQIARMKLEEQTTEEIADRLNISPRTVERKVAIIRKRWAKELNMELGDDEDDQGSVG